MMRILVMFLLTVGISGLAGAGCHSAKPGAANGFASVEITGNTPGQISAVAVEVFEAHGFKTTRRGIDNLVFERKGTTMDNVAYGGWMGSVWVRVKVSAAPVAETVCRLKCSAYFVQDKGSALEEEQLMKHAHRSEYQKLLEEVKQRLKASG